MDSKIRKAHWEKVFETKDTSKVSWYQPVPETSLRLIDELNLSKSADIIEVGAGDSCLGDFLLDKGYFNITLLDISNKALDTIKLRLSEKNNPVNFIVNDIIWFSSDKKYNLWHDRAVFHFLTDTNDIQQYVQNVSESIAKGGYLIIGTFSTDGPNVCSDLNVVQYSEKEMIKTFYPDFEKIKCFTENHITPSGGSQNFIFCVFQRK